MKVQLILLDTPIIVSDEIIKVGDQFHHKGEIILFENGEIDSIWFDSIKNGKKIIAGLPELPKIDFNGFEERLGIIDIEKLAKEDFFNKQYEYHLANNHLAFFKSGFKAAQELNEKKFSLADIEEAVKFGCVMPKTMSTINKQIKEYCEKVSQPKVFDIEVEMEEYCLPMPNIHVKKYRPKITNNSIKITKIL